MTGSPAKAYDRIAADYDRVLERDAWMRRALWRHYLRVFAPGSRLLDVGCGTGLDSLFLARRGFKVTGTDASPLMVAELRRKASAEELDLAARVADADEICASPSGSFDGIISAFAALNTVPDLSRFALCAHSVLAPEGIMIVHMLAPPGIWQSMGMALRGNWREARAVRQQRELTISVCGEPIRHRLLTPEETYAKFFSSAFHCRRVYSLGFLWNQHWNDALPAGIKRIGTHLEPHLGVIRPFRGWGTFFVLELQKRSD
jgi:2-polyprenyl-3-methyl-5-hydroxy-6-metoxy-1,4-benzoquinol methylase